MLENLLRKVQSVQNAATRLLNGTWHYDHIPTLAANSETSGVQDCVLYTSCGPQQHRRTLLPTSDSYLSTVDHISLPLPLAVPEMRTSFGYQEFCCCETMFAEQCTS